MQYFCPQISFSDGPVIPLDQLLEILSNDGLISVVKVLTDWLRAEIDTIKSTAEVSLKFRTHIEEGRRVEVGCKVELVKWV